jgi:hypothetical protein
MAKAARMKRKASPELAKLRKTRKQAKGKRSSSGALGRAMRSSKIALMGSRTKFGAAVKFGKLNSEIEKALTGSRIFRQLRLVETALPDKESQLSAEQAAERFQLVQHDIRRAMVLSREI